MTIKTLQEWVKEIQKSPELKTKKKYDHISYRTLFIRNLLQDSPLTPLIGVPLHQIGHHDDVRKVLNKKTLKFAEVMTILNCKLLYIKSGSTGHTFRGLITADRESPPFSVAVKIVPYPKRERYGSMNRVERPENVELIMLRVLSKFVLGNQTPHIVLPISTFNTSIRPFVTSDIHQRVAHKRYQDFVKGYEKGEYYEHVSVLISEWANGGDLLDYLRKNLESIKSIHWKVIFFQIIGTLAIIHEDYPEFRLNDAKCNNILVHRIESHRSNRHRYIINGIRYTVPNIGIQIKIWDFDFACLPNLVDNSKVDAKWTDKINVRPVQNRYYDLHMFVNTLLKKGFLPEILTSENVAQEVKDFMERVVPHELRSGSRVTEKGRLLIDFEYTIPEDLLKDPFFEEFVDR